MKKNKFLIINIILLIILIAIISLNVFFNKEKPTNKKENNKKTEYVYLCENYNKKWYTKKKDSTGGVRCHKFKFKCNDCEIDSNYLKNKIVYYDNDKIFLYDIINQKNIKEMTSRYDTLRFLTENNEIYGFNYVDLEHNNYIYNLNTDTEIKIDGDICNSNCGIESEENNLIYDDKIIIQKNSTYSVLDLKTGKEEISNKNYINRVIINDYDEENHETVIEKIYYIMPYNDEEKYSRSLYNDKFEVILKNDNKENDIYKSNNLDILNNDIILAEINEEYFKLIDFTGKEYENFKININEINENIYDKIEQEELKNKIDKNDIFNTIKENNGFDVTYSSYDNSVYVNFNYNDNFYETYINLDYVYNISKKSLEKYENEEIYEN